MKWQFLDFQLLWIFFFANQLLWIKCETVTTSLYVLLGYFAVYGLRDSLFGEKPMRLTHYLSVIKYQTKKVNKNKKEKDKTKVL